MQYNRNVPIGGIAGIGRHGPLVLFNRPGKVAVLKERIAGILERFSSGGSRCNHFVVVVVVDVDVVVVDDDDAF
jgi:hypothetical protein